MIAIASSANSERSALASLCEVQGWATIECDSVRAALRSLQRHRPRILVANHRFSDGYSDDIIAALAARDLLSRTKIIVLVEAGVPSTIEVRQILLGADCVLRNPVRTDVLTAYLQMYLKFTRPPAPRTPDAGPATINFCGGVLAPMERTLCYGNRSLTITPREAVLIELLTQAAGSVVSYERLYGEIIGRKFRGDTSNMRVLLGKLAASCRCIGMSIRPSLRVIPKTGYRYDDRNATPPTTDEST